MTPILNTTHDYTISHSFQPGHQVSGARGRMALRRRISPVLSVEELRQIVRQMVD